MTIRHGIVTLYGDSLPLRTNPISIEFFITELQILRSLRWTFAFSSEYCCLGAAAGGRTACSGGRDGTSGMFGAIELIGVYQSDAMRSRPSLARLAGAGGTAPAAGSIIRRVNESNCAAMSVLPASASGTPELSAVDTVL